MQWLVLAFALNLGWTPNDSATVFQTPPALTYQIGETYVQVESEFRLFDLFYLGGDIGVGMFKKTIGVEFDPVLSSYGFKAGIRFKGVEIGWSHLCQHSVLPDLPLPASRLLWEGGFDEFHVKFSGEIRF